MPVSDTVIPRDIGLKLKVFRKLARRLLNILFTFNLRTLSRRLLTLIVTVSIFKA